jgi:hypothetical protein
MTEDSPGSRGQANAIPDCEDVISGTHVAPMINIVLVSILFVNFFHIVHMADGVLFGVSAGIFGL